MQTYSIVQSASILDVSPATIRRWTNVFASHLSALATPGKGQTRILTEDDMRVLAYIHDRLRLGASLRMIDSELPTATLPPLSAVVRESLITVRDDDTAPSDTALATLTTAQLRLADSLAALVELGALRAELAELRRRVDELTALAQDAHSIAHTHPGIVPHTKITR